MGLTQNSDIGSDRLGSIGIGSSVIVGHPDLGSLKSIVLIAHIHSGQVRGQRDIVAAAMIMSQKTKHEHTHKRILAHQKKKAKNNLVAKKEPLKSRIRTGKTFASRKWLKLNNCLPYIYVRHCSAMPGILQLFPSLVDILTEWRAAICAICLIVN